MCAFTTPKHIIVGLSGGVDSAVTAYTLKAAGHHVEAIFMKNWEGDDTDQYCAAAEDLKDAQQVADALKIEFHSVNFADQYWERVFTYFLDEYRAGRTPNPDILCNKEIKFKAFLDYAKTRGADFIATGHYARIKHEHENVYLLKGIDPQKDQSYFLHALDRNQIAQSLFPIGDLQKTHVREIAATIGLKNHAKKDSTGICFIGERKFKNFLNEYLPAQSGDIQTIDGKTIGTHEGLMFYTIGQRQGLGIGGLKNTAELPWYVVTKDLKNNILIVAQGDHPLLYQDTLYVNDIHWINAAPTLPLQLKAKIRYRQTDQVCILEKLNNTYRVQFATPQRAVTPGQSIVFYDDEICLGGGMIN